MTDHLGADVSAYLDGALAPAERARVQSHLDACSPCRARLEELRATASLVAALPSPRPSRRLAPRFVERLNWLRPLRSLSLVASGAFLFLFMATAILETGSDLGGGPLAPFGPAAPARVPEAVSLPPVKAAPNVAPSPAPAADIAVRTTAPRPPGAPAPTAGSTFQVRGASPQPFQPPAPVTPFNIGTADPRAFGLPGDEDRASRETARGGSGSDPLVWLALAIVAAVLAFVAHRRLRAT